MKILNFVIIFFAGFCFFACCTEEKPLLVKINPIEMNPTSYLFAKSEEDVINAIIEAVGSHKSSKFNKYNKYFLHENATTGVFELLRDDGNISKVYFRKNGEPYLFTPDKIQIFVNSLNENETEVNINVVKPKVRTQLTMFPTPRTFHRAWKFKPVLSTTVEEYEILQLIGKELGVTDMPEIKIPERVVF